MKKITLAAGLAAGLSSLTAIAGPDWQVIEKAREAKLAQIRAAQAQAQAQAQAKDSSHASATQQGCQAAVQTQAQK